MKQLRDSDAAKLAAFLRETNLSGWEDLDELADELDPPPPSPITIEVTLTSEEVREWKDWLTNKPWGITTEAWEAIGDGCTGGLGLPCTTYVLAIVDALGLRKGPT